MATKKPSANEVLLKQRVRELEQQVSEMKRRLDELRKAKNTTILKKEREIIEMNPPNLGRCRSSSSSVDPRVQELEQKVAAMEAAHEEKLSNLRRKHAAELELIKSSAPRVLHHDHKFNDKATTCRHPEEIEALQQTVCYMESENAALQLESSELQDRAARLLNQLSIKEAQWCELEEDLNLKLKMQWGEKYSEWMAKTEAKISELQAANDLLKSYLAKCQQKPPED